MNTPIRLGQRPAFWAFIWLVILAENISLFDRSITDIINTLCSCIVFIMMVGLQLKEIVFDMQKRDYKIFFGFTVFVQFTLSLRYFLLLYK